MTIYDYISQHFTFIPPIVSSIILTNTGSLGVFDTGAFHNGGFTFNTDESVMYSGSITDSTKITQYNLSTAGDITTAVANGSSVASITTGIQGISIAPDGSSIFVATWDAVDNFEEYSLSTPFDITSTITLVQSATIAGLPFGISDFSFKSDGTKLWVRDRDDDRIFESTLSVPWDISTLAFVGTSTLAGYGGGIHMAEAGDIMVNSLSGGSGATKAMLLQTNDTIIGTSVQDTITPVSMNAWFTYVSEDRDKMYTSDTRYITEWSINT
jgi:hypothetical protein